MGYEEGSERWRYWWGQPLGPIHIEIGYRDDEYDPSIYIMEGDNRYMARMTHYSIQSGLIEHHDFAAITKNAIHQRLLKGVYDMMIENNPIMPIHKKLVDLTDDPAAMLATITKNNSPNLFAQKDKIERSGLIYKHRQAFGPFDVWTLVHQRKLQVQKYRDKNGLRVIQCGQEKWSNGCRWGQIFLGNDIIGVHIGVHNGRAYLFEGNKKGYGRRSWLNQDGTIVQEHGIFDQYDGNLRQQEPINI